MAILPSITKTYEFVVNQQIPLQADFLATARKIWRQIVTTLLGLSSEAWTVDYSCNSSVAGTKGDGNNLWATDANLVWSTSGARSWMVLKNDAIMPGFELLIECRNLNSANTPSSHISVVMSYGAGFTGGTTTARPTATDEQVWLDGYAGSNTGCWVGNGYSAALANFSSVLHTWHSTDGQITYMVLMIANVPQLLFVMSRVNPQVAAWTTPGVGGFLCNSNNAYTVNSMTYANLVRNTKVGSRINDVDTSKFLMYFTVESFNASTVGEQQTYADDNSAEWPVLPIGLFSPTSGHRGRKGLMIDLWMGSTGATNGDTYPDDATKQFVQFGHMIFVWNGTTPVTS